MTAGGCGARTNNRRMYAMRRRIAVFYPADRPARSGLPDIAHFSNVQRWYFRDMPINDGDGVEVRSSDFRLEYLPVICTNRHTTTP